MRKAVIVTRRIIVLTLDGAAYREHGVFTPVTQASSLFLPGSSVDVSAVFAAGENLWHPSSSYFTTVTFTVAS